MPRRAWFEVYNSDGVLLSTLASTISGGSISTEMPSFDEAVVAIRCREYAGGEIVKGEPEEFAVGDGPLFMVDQIG